MALTHIYKESKQKGLFTILFLILSLITFSQTKQSYRNHEEISIGGGMKVEILKCTGEGAAEECDCIYFTDKRQTGNRMKVNANRLKEEERAAAIASGVNKKLKDLPGRAVVVDRADKEIPESIVPKVKAPGTPPDLSLEDAVKIADSMAKVRSALMDAKFSTAPVETDSIVMSRTEKLSGIEIKSDPSSVKENPTPPVLKVDSVNISPQNVEIPKAATVIENLTEKPTSPDSLHNDTIHLAKPFLVDSTLELKEKIDKPTSQTSSQILKAELKTELGTTGSGVMTTPGLGGENPKKKKVKMSALKPPVKGTSTEKKSTARASNFKSSTNSVAVQTSKDDGKIALADSLAKVSPLPKDTMAGLVKNEADKIDTKLTAPAPSANEVTAKTNSTDADKINLSPTPINAVGKSAEVNTKGEWEKVTVIDKETEFLYKVHYLGKGAESDEWVAVTQLRNIDSAEKKPVTMVTTKPRITNVNCSFDAPAPPVMANDRFSEKLAKRKIYDSYIAEKKENKLIKTGVTFLSLKAEEPYVNTVSISQDKNLDVKLTIAPPGAMIYPVFAEYKVCEQLQGRTTSKTFSNNYVCFRNKLGSWSCEIMK